MAKCFSGSFHTVTLSDDNTVYSFGCNSFGQLGLKHNEDVSEPSAILFLPKIVVLSCGSNFTVCIDEEGFMWSFGFNGFGQLGTGNKTNYNTPQKIQNIPPIQSVSCGGEHTLIITNNENLWSCGDNRFGQLCLGNTEPQSTFQQTSFSNILKISAGYSHSLFQNTKGEIYGCGQNSSGELGLGNFNSAQIDACLIPGQPLCVEQFFGGLNYSIFLDSDGNVFSVGINYCGCLGLGNISSNKNELNKIPNIPPIKMISCAGHSNYFVDFDGNVWSTGRNESGQLCHGDFVSRYVPTKITCIKNVEQISCGASSWHFLFKDSENKIFLVGDNYYGQLSYSRVHCDRSAIPKEINPKYSTIWGGKCNSKAKSARK